MYAAELQGCDCKTFLMTSRALVECSTPNSSNYQCYATNISVIHRRLVKICCPAHKISRRVNLNCSAASHTWLSHQQAEAMRPTTEQDGGTRQSFTPAGSWTRSREEPRIIPRWARPLYRKFCRDKDWNNSDFGFRINFADMPRMHMRVLQKRLIDIAMAIQFDDDRGYAFGGSDLGPALDDYGKFTTAASIFLEVSLFS